MKKFIKSLILTIILLGAITATLYLKGCIGIATAKVEADDNGNGNGYSYMCLTSNQSKTNGKIWVDMQEVKKGNRFLYIRKGKTNECKKIFIIE